MNSCDEIVVKTLRYLDNDLQGQELEEFRSHLQSCASCRAHLEAEKALSQDAASISPTVFRSGNASGQGISLGD